MGDNDVVVVKTDNKFAEFRRKPVVEETRSITEKWLRAQILERQASVTAWEAQIVNLEGKMEVATAEIRDLQERLSKL